MSALTATPGFTRAALRLLLMAACILTLVSVRVVMSARNELQQAQARLGQQDIDAAIVHLRRAARWYAPLSPYHARALGLLWELGEGAERAGELERALSAYRAVRGAILESLPEGVSLRSLGAWRFRGLPEPLAMFQAEAPDLPADFPPLRSAVPAERRA